MTKVLAVLLVALVVEAVGVVFLSRGLKQLTIADPITLSEVLRVGRRALTQPDVLLGVALEAVFFGALLYLLARHDVSLIWPLTSLGFVITAVAARFVLGETVTGVRWCGVVLIVIGAALVSYSEPGKTEGVRGVRAAPAAAPHAAGDGETQ